MTTLFIIQNFIIPLFYWFGLGFLLIAIVVGVVFGAVKLFTKQNFRLLLRYLIFPRPVLTYGLLNIFSFFLDDDVLYSILKLRNTLDNRFGSFLNAPLILNLGQIKAVSGNNVIFNHKGVHWYVSNRLGCINIEMDNIEEILCLLVDILPGRTFDVINIVINIKDIKDNTSHTLNDILNVVEKISNIICDIFVTVHIPNFFVPIDDTTIGFNLSGISRGYITRDFENFLSLFMNQLMINNNNLVPSVEQILQLYENKVMLIDFLSNLGSFKEKLLGIYFVGNKPLQQDKLYWNNLAELTLFNYTNNSVLLKSGSYARRNSIINNIFLISCVISFIWMVIYIPRQQRFFANFNKTLVKLQAIDPKNNIANTNLLNELQVEQLGIANKLLHGKYLDILDKLRAKLSDGTKDIHRDLSKTIPKASCESISNPVNSNSFDKLKDYTEKSRTILEKLYGFDMAKYGKPSNSLVENSKKIKQTIVNQFTIFFKGLNNNKFSLVVKKIKLLLNDLLKNPQASRSELYTLRHLFTELKILLENTMDYQWWTKKNNLGYNYDILMQKVKTIPMIGQDSHDAIISKENQIVYNIRYNNLEAEHVLIGQFLNLNGESIVFSDKLNKFLSMLDWCLMQQIIQLDSPNIEVPTIKPHEYYIWDCDKLDNIIYYINIRQKFLDDIKSYENLTQNVLQKIADNTLKSFIHSQIILSATADSNDLGLEIKVDNLRNGYDKLKKIQYLCKIHLRQPLNNLFVIVEDSVHKLVKSIKEEFNRTIYTSYKNLDSWDGSESIIKFLFSVNESEFGVIMTNGLNDFKNMYVNYAEPILDLLREYDNHTYKNMKYIGEQLKMYENNKKNDISLMEDFLTSLTSWKIQWNLVKKPSFVKNLFFKKHLEHFKRNVYMSTNRLTLEKSIKYYNEIADLFNSKIKGNFPFGKGYEVDSKYLADFLVLYQKYRKHLLQDRGFLSLISESIQMKQVMDYLEKLNNFFIVNYPIVKYKIKIQFDTEDGERKHTNILYQIISQFSVTSLYKKDLVEHESNVDDFMGITIPIAQDSSLIFSPESKNVTYYPTMLKIFYATSFGYIRFVNRFQESIKNRYRVLRFKFPLMKKNDKAKHIAAALSFYGRAYDVPEFIFHMPKITTKQ